MEDTCDINGQGSALFLLYTLVFQYVIKLHGLLF